MLGRSPSSGASSTAFGDLAAGLAALVALLAVKLRAPGAIALVWIFSTVGIADLVFATLKAVGAAMYTFAMEWNWYILNFYAPMLVVSHVMVIHLLTRPSAVPSARPAIT